ELDCRIGKDHLFFLCTVGRLLVNCIGPGAVGVESDHFSIRRPDGVVRKPGAESESGAHAAYQIKQPNVLTSRIVVNAGGERVAIRGEADHVEIIPSEDAAGFARAVVPSEDGS